MTRNERLSEPSATVLRYLRSLESQGEGYEVRGVRGWARSIQVERATGVYGSAEQMRKLATSGRVMREDVRVRDGVAAAVWVYRISDEGAQLVDQREGWEHGPVQPPGEGVVNQAYVNSTATAALHALRHAAKHPGRRVWIPCEPEWRTSRELTEWLKAEGDQGDLAPMVFFPDDLPWLVRNNLAERRDDPATIYRITARGAALQPLVWHGTEPPEI